MKTIPEQDKPENEKKKLAEKLLILAEKVEHQLRDNKVTCRVYELKDKSKFCLFFVETKERDYVIDTLKIPDE